MLNRSAVCGVLFLPFSLVSHAVHSAALDFTIPSSGFAVESFTMVGGSSLPAGTISGSGELVKEAGFESITLDVTGENLDIYITDVLSGNPYFDGDSGGRDGGLGSCRVLTSSAQCAPSSDDNLTITESEAIRMDFRTDSGASQQAFFGDFTFRDNNHFLINGAVQVSHDGGSSIISVLNGIADFSVIDPSSFLIFNDQPGATSNYYVSQANISAVPVPAAVWLLGSALGGLLALRRRR